MAALRPPLLRGTLCWKWISWSCRSYSTGASTNKGPARGFRKGTGTHGKKADRKPKFFEALTSFNKIQPHKFNEGVEWSSVCQTARPFDPYLIPLSLRMGRPPKGEVPPPAEGNHELLKIPNFFHLTPPAIEKHCAALKKLCTEWPRRLPPLPVTISSINKLSASSDIRHDSSRIVKLRFKVSDLNLPKRARTKMIKLASHRYNKKDDVVTLIGDRCPVRKQNKEYVEYIMKVLVIESMKQESWEKEK